MTERQMLRAYDLFKTSPGHRDLATLFARRMERIVHDRTVQKDRRNRHERAAEIEEAGLGW
jgi:hypothetical protein